MWRGIFSVCGRSLTRVLNSELCILENVIGPRSLLAGKARILVTHSIAFIKYCDTLLYMRRGVILDRGSYDRLMNDSDSYICKLV